MKYYIYRINCAFSIYILDNKYVNISAKIIPGVTYVPCVWSRTLPSWCCRIYRAPALTSPDVRLSCPDNVWSKTVVARCPSLLTEHQGLMYLRNSLSDSWGSCLPHTDHSFVIWPLRKSGQFFLIWPPIDAASWSNCDCIRPRLVISDAWSTQANAILVLPQRLFLTLSLWVVPYPDHVSLMLLWILEIAWCPHSNTMLVRVPFPHVRVMTASKYLLQLCYTFSIF